MFISLNEKELSIIMGKLTETATVFATALAAAVSTNSVDPAHLANLDAEVAALKTNGQTDEENIADLQGAVTAITSAL